MRIFLNVIDLTGAGDLFAAGYLHGYLNNFSQEESLKKGTDMASKIIQQIGARIKKWILMKNLRMVLML